MDQLNGSKVMALVTSKGWRLGDSNEEAACSIPQIPESRGSPSNTFRCLRSSQQLALELAQARSCPWARRRMAIKENSHVAEN
jgi:hypothetical protein